MQCAVELYQVSAAQGFAQAQCTLAHCFEHGKGGKQSIARAVEPYRAAAAHGRAYAQSRLDK